MSEPTKEQRLVEWLNDRLGLVYLGLTQLSESPGYWETYYEDEIEPLESIRALIESSSDKASGQDESSSIGGYPDSARRALSPAPTIKQDVTVDPTPLGEAMNRLSRAVGLAYYERKRRKGKTAAEEMGLDDAAILVVVSALQSSAPLPAEVEEAMERMDFAIQDAFSARQDLTTQKGYTMAKAKEDLDMDEAAFSVLKAALSKSAPSSEEREEMVRLVDLTIHMEMEGYFGNGQADEQDKEIIRIVKLWQKLRALILAPPIRVTGKDIGDLCLKLLACPFNDVKDTFVEWFHEKGIEVET